MDFTVKTALFTLLGSESFCTGGVWSAEAEDLRVWLGGRRVLFTRRTGGLLGKGADLRGVSYRE